MYEKKRFLLKTVFDTARNELPNSSSITSISDYLSSLFEERYNFSRDGKSYKRYYKSLVEKNEDYKIDDLALLYLSKYISYDNFEDFCSRVQLDNDNPETFSLSFKDLSEKFQQIFITVTPTVFFSDVFKKNGLGILEMTFVLLMVTGGVVFSNNKTSKALGWMPGWGSPATDKPYMYWDKDRYMATDSSSLHSRAEVVPMRDFAFINMKKIMRPDTLTVDNAMGKVWYDKSNNHVEFFTSLGKHPENGKALKDVTEYILETYAGENAVLEEE
ncbi:hypothetical protein [Chryseobacterium gambrini]|uniref:hypothetical protein n=1 Tax=Chryseobacterium gambrini TaxID=373672 RepID=UPI0025B6272A|nr:hypothetical protein [Chryseobacterium gambrini]MDN4029685.1 hypothetical protein [Chryseobacterium gambrini]